MDSLFFKKSDLRYCGENVIIGKTVRIRYPHLVELHDDVIIDDFVFISTGLVMEHHTAIMPNCALTGGQGQKIYIKKYSSVASNCSIMTTSHDFARSLHLVHQNDFPQDFIRGDVSLEKHSIIGCNSTIMPGTTIGTGARVGAQSFVNKNLLPWTLYAGSPAREIGKVDRTNVLNGAAEFDRWA